jgi:hypothetical protein
MKEQHFQDLITDACPLGCDICSRVYVNEYIGHRILCRCKRCNHGNMEQNVDKSGDFEFPARSRQIYQHHQIETPNLTSTIEGAEPLE